MPRIEGLDGPAEVEVALEILRQATGLTVRPQAEEFVARVLDRLTFKVRRFDAMYERAIRLLRKSSLLECSADGECKFADRALDLITRGRFEELRAILSEQFRKRQNHTGPASGCRGRVIKEDITGVRRRADGGLTMTGRTPDGETVYHRFTKGAAQQLRNCILD